MASNFPDADRDRKLMMLGVLFSQKHFPKLGSVNLEVAAEGFLP